MPSRLVVGCGTIGHAIVTKLAEQPGELVVLLRRKRGVERLREEGIAAHYAETVDVEAVREVAPDPETVVVAAEDTDANLAASRVVREAYSEVLLVAYAGEGSDDADSEALASLADRFLDPGVATREAVMDRIGDEGVQVRQLRRVFRTIDPPLAIVAHDNPDPDAIASAVALRRIAEAMGVEAEVCYYGEITHQENRAFVNLLEYEMRHLDRDAPLEEFGGFALVDHSRPGVNDQLPESTPIDIVIDHHPPRSPVEARFVDLRSDVGATSTLLVEYLQQLGIPMDESVATGLLFGIRIDTKDFSREVSVADFEAAATLVPRANVGTLERIESPSISGETLETIAKAIRNRHVQGSIVTSYAGELNERDALAQAADRLLDLERVNATVVYGLIDGVIYISGRARGTDLDLGETLRDAFDQIGSAGGHAGMAGAQVPVEETVLGLETDDGDGADLSDIDVAGFVTDRFYEALSTRPSHELSGLHVDADALAYEREW